MKKFLDSMFAALAAFCMVGTMPAMANTDPAGPNTPAMMTTDTTMTNDLANDSGGIDDNAFEDTIAPNDSSGAITNDLNAMVPNDDTASAGANAIYTQASPSGNKTEKSPPSDSNSGNGDNKVKKLVPEVAMKRKGSHLDLRSVSGRFTAADCSA